MKARDVGRRLAGMRSLRLGSCLFLGAALLAACKHAPPPDTAEPNATPALAPAAPRATKSTETAFREPAPAVSGSSDAAEITCSFHWRRSVSHDFRPRDEKLVRMAEAGEARALELGDTRIGVALEESAGGGRRLVVGIDLGTTEIDDDFDFGAALHPASLPPGGHGFTGLHYVTHPSSGSELQYWCDSSEPPTAGPASPADTAIMCEAVVVEGGEASNAFHALEVSAATPLQGSSLEAGLGARRLGVTYLPGSFESGGVMLGVGPARGDGSLVHVLYQLHGEDLPANLFTGTFGFTGRTTVRDARSGDHVEYGCWAVDRA